MCCTASAVWSSGYASPAVTCGLDTKPCLIKSACVLHCLCSVEFRLRFPGSDLWSGHKALPYEVSLMFLLLGAVYVHHLPQLLGQFGVAPSLLENAPQHIAATVVVLLLPGAVAATTDGLMRITAGKLHFTKCICLCTGA